MASHLYLVRLLALIQPTYVPLVSRADYDYNSRCLDTKFGGRYFVAY